MIASIIHPSVETLKRLLDDDLAPRRRSRVRAHLAGCARCQGTLRQLRSLAAAAAALPHPVLPAGGARRVLERRARGDRVILPDVAAPAAAAPSRRWAGLAAAGALVAIAVGSLLGRTDTLEAGSPDGELRLTPAAPRAGATVDVRYRPGALFRRGDRLRLRGHLVPRRAGTPEPVLTLAELEPSGDGTYRGTFQLPDSVDYAQLAVETTDGARVDDNRRHTWEVLVHDAGGRPTFEALHARYGRLQMTNWEAATETAREMARLYPDRPTGWSGLMSAELLLAGPAAADSLRALHAPRFATLHATHAGRRDVSPHVMWELALMAGRVRDSAAARYWKERLYAEHPSEGMQLRTWDVTGTGEPPARKLERLEALWQEGGRGSIQLEHDALMLAAQSRQPAAVVRRWGERLLASHPTMRGRVAFFYAQYPELDADARAVLGASLRALADTDAAWRPVGLSAPEFVRRRGREMQEPLLALARVLLRAGTRVDSAAAADTLRAASRLAWHAGVARLLGELQLAAGDTAGAARSWARAVADPRTPSAAADSLRTRLGAGVPAPAWTRLVDRADAELRDEILRDAERRPVPARVAVRDPAGRAVALPELAGDRITVVAFLSRHCFPSRLQTARLQQVADRLARNGVRVVVIVGEPPSAAQRREFAGLGLTLPLHYDARGEAARALRPFGTPHLFVLDARGVVRFDTFAADEALLQATALQGGAMRDARLAAGTFGALRAVGE